jgi:hypothetical protein
MAPRPPGHRPVWTAERIVRMSVIELRNQVHATLTGPGSQPPSRGRFCLAAHVTGNLLLPTGFYPPLVTAPVGAIGSDWRGPPALDLLAAHVFPRKRQRGLRVGVSRPVMGPTQLQLPAARSEEGASVLRTSLIACGRSSRALASAIVVCSFAYTCCCSA